MLVRRLPACPRAPQAIRASAAAISTSSRSSSEGARFDGRGRARLCATPWLRVGLELCHGGCASLALHIGPAAVVGAGAGAVSNATIRSGTASSKARSCDTEQNGSGNASRLPRVPPRLHVQVVRRLVEDKQSGARRNEQGERQPPPLPAPERRGRCSVRLPAGEEKSAQEASGLRARSPVAAAVASRGTESRRGQLECMLREVAGNHSMPEPDLPVVERMGVEHRCEIVVFPAPLGPTRPTFFATLDDDRRSVAGAACRRRTARGPRLRGRCVRSGRVEEVEPERRRFFVSDSTSCCCAERSFSSTGDLGELRLRLLRLGLLVPEPLDEALEAGDVDGDAVRCLAGRGGAGGLLLPPLVPRAREVVRATGGQLEHGRRDRLEEPAIVRDEDHGRVDRLELALEPLEVLDVEVVRRLVEEDRSGLPGERACERRAGQLAARERAERAVEVVVGESEAAHRCGCAIAPRPASRVLEPRLRLGIATEASPRRGRLRPSPSPAAGAPPRRRQVARARSA